MDFRKMLIGRKGSGAATISYDTNYVMGMRYLGASVPLPLVPGTNVAELHVVSKEPRVLVALSIWYKRDSKALPEQVSFFLELVRDGSGLLVVELDKQFVPASNVCLEATGEMHAVVTDGQVYTTSEKRAKQEVSARWVEPGQMCRFALGLIDASGLHGYSLDLCEPTELDKLKGDLGRVCAERDGLRTIADSQQRRLQVASEKFTAAISAFFELKTAVELAMWSFRLRRKLKAVLVTTNLRATELRGK